MLVAFSYVGFQRENCVVGEDVEKLKQRLPLLDYLRQQSWTARPIAFGPEFVGLCPLHPEPGLRSMSTLAKISSSRISVSGPNSRASVRASLKIGTTPRFRHRRFSCRVVALQQKPRSGQAAHEAGRAARSDLRFQWLLLLLFVELASHAPARLAEPNPYRPK